MTPHKGNQNADTPFSFFRRTPMMHSITHEDMHKTLIHVGCASLQRHSCTLLPVSALHDTLSSLHKAQAFSLHTGLSDPLCCCCAALTLHTPQNSTPTCFAAHCLPIAARTTMHLSQYHALLSEHSHNYLVTDLEFDICCLFRV